VDSTCAAVYAALQAGEKGLPFIPLRGLIGSDLLAHRSDWKVIDNPFAPGDPVALLPALRPDVALFHAPLADRAGNVFIGRRRELMIMAHAARETFVTVEELTEDNLLEDPGRAAAVIPAIYISLLACVKRGAWPLGLTEVYGADAAAIAHYADLARSAEGFSRYLCDWLERDARPA
jgi:glutaconate CoA-transferase subunit A